MNSAIPRAIEPKPPLKDRFQTLLAAYGRVVLIIYFAIFALVLSGFAIAIRMGASSAIGARLGVQLDSTASDLGTLGLAWVFTKFTQPLRIVATLVLTPIVAKLVEKFGKKPPPPASPPTDAVL